jgi:hypothetical protein
MNFFRIMPCRYSGLENTLKGYDLTNVQLVAYDDSCLSGAREVFSPAGLSDNIGSYFFIPKLVQLTGIKLEIAIQLVYSGFVFLAFLSAAIAIWLFFKSLTGKLIGIMALALLSFVIAGIGDYYIFAGAIPMAIIPWLMHILKKPPINVKYLYLFFFLLGIVISFGHLIRSHSGSDVIIFILLGFVFFAKSYSYKQKTILILIFTLSMASVFSWFNSIVDKRVEYLTSIESNYELSGKRIMWHNIYYSLGYLQNSFSKVKGYDRHEQSDTYSVKRALEINPHVKLWSSEYEDILRKETFSFIADHKLFFIKTILVKIGVMLVYIALFMNIGLVMLFYYNTDMKFHLLFLSGIAFNMIFGVLTSPNYTYLTGLFLFSVLYSIYIIDSAIYNGFVKRNTLISKNKLWLR